MKSGLGAFSFALFACIICIGKAQQHGTGADDLITEAIPGLNFKPSFQQYSGYLNGQDGKNLFYWFVKSQNDPSKDPVLLWLQGGPGCSSLGGFVTELGPFHLNPDGHSLWENVFAWNKFSNVLFIESPSGVGYSYSSPKNDTTTDDLAAFHNFHALRDFFYNKFPEYQNHDFYITGESYAGVYIPTLAKLVIDGIAEKSFPNNFRGVAIGNGILSEQQQFNSLLNLMYYHGIIGSGEWNVLLDACCSNQTSDYCDFYSQIDLTASNNCTKAVDSLAYQAFGAQYVNDPYNMYQDCYSDEEPYRRTTLTQIRRRFKLRPIGRVRSIAPGTQDMSHQVNYDSTDSNFGFQCWANDEAYFNNDDVKKMLHVAKEVRDKRWCTCCNIPYIRTYYDMSETFAYILKNSTIRILVYNGDVDLVCNFLGDQWFVERQVVPENGLQVVSNREPWTYRNQIAGYVKRFQRIDLLTVKGSGHFVPEDRPGPALQMIVNFVRNSGDYSKSTGIDVTPKSVNVPAVSTVSPPIPTISTTPATNSSANNCLTPSIVIVALSVSICGSVFV